MNTTAPVASVATVIDPPAQNQSKTKLVKARVLVDCEYGNPNDLVEIPASAAKEAEKAGQIDTDEAAVAYALSLVKKDAQA
jgi:hypothetical protein